MLPSRSSCHLCVQRDIAGDGGAEVRKLMDGVVEFIVVDGDDWRCLRAMYQDVRLLQADAQPEVLAGLRDAVHRKQ